MDTIKLKKIHKVVTNRTAKDIIREYIGICEEGKTLHGAHIAVDILDSHPIYPHVAITKFDTVQSDKIYEEDDYAHEKEDYEEEDTEVVINLNEPMVNNSDELKIISSSPEPYLLETEY